MSHRNGKPKPHASERTWRRWRDRHGKATHEDNKFFKERDSVKERIMESLAKFKIIPKKEDDKLVVKGARKK